jgi:hypothetical protein
VLFQLTEDELRLKKIGQPFALLLGRDEAEVNVSAVIEGHGVGHAVPQGLWLAYKPDRPIRKAYRGGAQIIAADKRYDLLLPRPWLDHAAAVDIVCNYADMTPAAGRAAVDGRAQPYGLTAANDSEFYGAMAVRRGGKRLGRHD